jgi:hypothetical protein
MMTRMLDDDRKYMREANLQYTYTKRFMGGRRAG